MGLIGDNCTPCSRAAGADNGHGGGLAGRWWRFWAVVRVILQMHNQTCDTTPLPIAD
jgi:hypothetical protein